jgi:hypothetical protein
MSEELTLFLLCLLLLAQGSLAISQNRFFWGIQFFVTGAVCGFVFIQMFFNGSTTGLVTSLAYLAALSLVALGLYRLLKNQKRVEKQGE